MSLTKNLDRLASAGAYIGTNRVKVRWGELLRTNPTLSQEQSELLSVGKLTNLSDLGRIRGGVVTRANAYFLVREIPFDQIPERMRVTRDDLRRIRVIVDGLDYLSKVELDSIRHVIKGPESLESAFDVKLTDVRLFDVRESKADLTRKHANGTLAYLRRGETVNFKTSDDDLKGGIPAERSQVKNRRPFWYSLQGDQGARTRIVFPEHIDKRYVFTLIPSSDASVVIDKLYLFEPKVEDDAALTHVALNSLLSWYQVELRGRSQMGEGVLELKIPDFGGLQVLNPARITDAQRNKLLQAFAELPRPGSGPSLSELGTAQRHEFDMMYLKCCGFSEPEGTLLRLEQGLRALAGERTERKLSVADAKVSRRKIANVAASIDAYAARLATSIEPHPDPRSFTDKSVETEAISILGEVDGQLEIGVELFNQGEVFAGTTCVARTSTILAAQFVRGVLLAQPDLRQVDVPLGKALEKVVAAWTRESKHWQRRFKIAADKAMVGMEDPRARTQVEQRALKLLHAT